MKYAISTLILFLFVSSCYANSIAIEFQENEKFTGVIGKAYLNENSIELVTFAEINDEIIPFAWIYQITERIETTKGIQKIQCRNQLGVTSTGIIDTTKPYRTNITITSNNGVTITNISSAGEKMKNQYIPAINLGN